MNLMHIPGPSPLWTNTFLVFTAAGHAVAIDPTAPPTRYLEALQQHGAALTNIFLTHGHYDHVGAVRALKAATGAKVYMDLADAKGDTMFPLAAADVDAAYPENGSVTVDELTFKTWHTPGHSAGSWCLYCEGVLFSGDTLFAGSCGRVDLPGGSAVEMQRSLSMLKELPLPDETNVYPGHEGFSTLGAERRHNPYMQQW